MQARSRLKMVLYLAAPVLLALICGVIPHFAASIYPMLKARSILPTVADNEATDAEPHPFRAEEAQAPLDVKNVWQVRMVFHSHDYDERQEKQRQYLVRIGDKAFPAFEAILSDPKSPHYEVCGVLVLLRDVKADRRPFLKHTVSRLEDGKVIVRLCAVALLEQIGSPTEASPVVALLSDERIEVAHAAARALAAIGGPNEVVAMDVWLRGVSHRDDADLRKHVQKCRDELKKRLDDRARDPSK